MENLMEKDNFAKSMDFVLLASFKMENPMGLVKNKGTRISSTRGTTKMERRMALELNFG